MPCSLVSFLINNFAEEDSSDNRACFTTADGPQAEPVQASLVQPEFAASFLAIYFNLLHQRALVAGSRFNSAS